MATAEQAVGLRRRENPVAVWMRESKDCKKCKESKRSRTARSFRGTEVEVEPMCDRHYAEYTSFIKSGAIPRPMGAFDLI